MLMQKKFFSVVVVRSVEQQVDVIVEALNEDQAHTAAIAHLKEKGAEYAWSAPQTDYIVWHKREIDTPAIVDVTA
jgi:hypothetical protein